MKTLTIIFSIIITTAIVAAITFASSHNPNPNQKTYELLIKKTQTGEGKGAYEPGDIIMIKEQGYNWSSSERQNFSIVKMELTENQLEQLTKPKQKDTGQKDENGNPIIEQEKRRKYQIDNIEEKDSGEIVGIEDVRLKN